MKKLNQCLLVGAGLFLTMSLTMTAQAALSGDIGAVRPLTDWKVQEVPASKTSTVPGYCVSMNTFEQGVKLALGKSTQGRYSLAVDLPERYFKAGQDYGLSLKHSEGYFVQLHGRAISEKSVVVQIGEDDLLFAALRTQGSMRLHVDGLEMKVSLATFSKASDALEDCVASLEQSVEDVHVVKAIPVEPVEQDVVNNDNVVEGLRADEVEIILPPSLKPAEVASSDAVEAYDYNADIQDTIIAERQKLLQSAEILETVEDEDTYIAYAERQETLETMAKETLVIAEQDIQTPIAETPVLKAPKKTPEIVIAKPALRPDRLISPLVVAEPIRKADIAWETSSKPIETVEVQSIETSETSEDSKVDVDVVLDDALDIAEIFDIVEMLDFVPLPQDVIEPVVEQVLSESTVTVWSEENHIIAENKHVRDVRQAQVETLKALSTAPVKVAEHQAYALVAPITIKPTAQTDFAKSSRANDDYAVSYVHALKQFKALNVEDTFER